MTIFLIDLRFVSFQGSSLSTAQKKVFIQKITEITKEVTHVPEQFITVVIQEFSDDNLGVAGKTVRDIKSEINK